MSCWWHSTTLSSSLQHFPLWKAPRAEPARVELSVAYCTIFQATTNRVAGVQGNGCTSRCLKDSDSPRGQFNLTEWQPSYRMHYGHKKCPCIDAERLTCALPSGLPLSFKRGQRYDKIPKPPNDFGIFFIFRLHFVPFCPIRHLSLCHFLHHSKDIERHNFLSKSLSISRSSQSIVRLLS